MHYNIILKSFEKSQLADMIYMKDNGDLSKRRVKVLKLTDDSFQAYCFLRETKRTFKVANVLAFVPIVARERGVI